MDDIAFISPDAETTQRVLSKVSRISATLGFRVNNTKTEICKWNPSTTNATVLWEGVPHKVFPRYFGTWGTSRPTPTGPTRPEITTSSLSNHTWPNTNQYPLNGWERAQLVNFVLLPRWLHHLVLLPSNKTLHQIDTLVADFIRAPKGMEATMNHHMLGTPPEEGGMGVGQMYWAYRRKYVTSM